MVMNKEKKIIDLHAEASNRIAPIHIAENLRSRVVHLWQLRMLNAHVSALLCEDIYRQVVALSLTEIDSGRLLDLSTTSRRSAVSCAAAVDAFGGYARTHVVDVLPYVLQDVEASFPNVTQQVVGFACFNEVFAASVGAPKRANMSPGPLRQTINELYTNARHHADMCWSMLGLLLLRCEPSYRTTLAHHLSAVFMHLEVYQLQEVPHFTESVDSLASLGLSPYSELYDTFHTTIHKLILPRLAAKRIATVEVWENRSQYVLTP